MKRAWRLAKENISLQSGFIRECSNSFSCVITMAYSIAWSLEPGGRVLWMHSMPPLPLSSWGQTVRRIQENSALRRPIRIKMVRSFVVGLWGHDHFTPPPLNPSLVVIAIVLCIQAVRGRNLVFVVCVKFVSLCERYNLLAQAHHRRNMMLLLLTTNCKVVLIIH